MMSRVVAGIVMVLALTTPVLAGDIPSATSAPTTAAPLEISADNGLVWDRTNRSYTAKGNAEVRQGDMNVTADLITARYASDDSSSDIQTVTAEGNVILAQPPYTAYGDRAEYDVVNGQAVMTGADLRIVTPDERLTAQDRITYHAVDGRMTAEGGAVMTRGTDSLTAETLTATFATDAAGKRGLDVITAEGGVTIKTPRETITGKRGVYRGQTQQAELTGTVVIEQGPNRLQGNRATVDMKTGVSRLFGAGGGDGRVRGIFYPKSAKATPALVPATATPASPVARPPAILHMAPRAPAAAAPTAAPPSSPATVADTALAVDAAPVPAPARQPDATVLPAPAPPVATDPPAEPLPDEPFAVPTPESTP